MTGLKYLLLVSAICAFCKVEAQKEPQDPYYIRTFPHTFTVRTFLGEKLSGFSLADNARSQKLLYRPNNVLGLGVGITALGMGLNFSARLPAHKTKDDRYGKTKQLDLQLHRYKGKFALDVYAQQYKGFHLRDSNAVTAVIGPTDYPYFPNLQNITVGATGLYVFNGRRYSLRAPVDQQDWQIRSAGSALFGGSIFTHFISNSGESIIPPYMKQTDFLGGSRINGIRNYGLTVNGGYGYNYIIHEHYFVAVSGDIGLGLAYMQIFDQMPNYQSKFSPLVNGNARFAIGYNSNKWFAGFSIIYRTDWSQLPYDKSDMGSNEGLARLYLARRIHTHSKLLANKR